MGGHRDGGPPAARCIANEKYLDKKIQLPSDLQSCCVQSEVGVHRVPHWLLSYLNFHEKCFQNRRSDRKPVADVGHGGRRGSQQGLS